MPGYCGIYSLYNPTTGENETQFGQFLPRETRQFYDQTDYPESAELDPKKLYSNPIPKQNGSSGNSKLSNKSATPTIRPN